MTNLGEWRAPTGTAERGFPKRRHPAALLLLILLAQLAVSQAFGAQREEVVTFDPDATTVDFTLGDVLHTVHGRFRLKSGVIRFDPNTGVASGALAVDATSGDSGNKSRDKKMNRDVLESQTYPEIVFIPQKVSGNVAAQGQSQVTVDGVFRMHGSDHPLAITVALSADTGQIQANTHFQVPYQAWGLKNPSTFLLRVSETVQISIAARGRMTQEQVQAQK